MNVLFIYPNLTRWYGEAPLGICYLSACLKQKGHKTKLFDLTRYTIQTGGHPLKSRQLHEDLEKLLKTFKPDLISFSVMSTNHKISIKLAEKCKTLTGSPIIFGGAHPTVDPEGTTTNEHVDIICAGEGEEAIIELAEALDKNNDTRKLKISGVNEEFHISLTTTKIKNLWIKTKAGTIKNQVRALNEDLDSLPFPDRSILDEGYLNNDQFGASFITSRGCPYKCSYCINSYLQDLYKGKGKFVRFRDINKVIEEIKQAKEKYNIKKVTFSDETFMLNKKRFLEFAELYKKEICLPYLCQTRANMVDGDVAKALKDSGCEIISVGIESGNEHLMNKVMKRDLSKETIIKAFKILKKAGLTAYSFNMIGVPGETVKTIKETIEINQKINSDKQMCTIFMPFQGTELGNLCQEKGYIKKKDFSGDYYYQATVELPTITRKKLEKYAYLFGWYIKTPKCLWFLIDLLQIQPIYNRLHLIKYMARRLFG